MSTSINTIQTESFTTANELDKRKYYDIEEEYETPYAKKRAGRKAIQEDFDENSSDDPAVKRKAQNRAAQKAFRERKLNHIRVLEKKIDDLQQREDKKNLELLSENEKLKQIVDQLEKEKALLLGASISMDYIQQQQQPILDLGNAYSNSSPSSDITTSLFDVNDIQSNQHELQINKIMNAHHQANMEEHMDEVVAHSNDNLGKSSCPTPEDIAKAWDRLYKHPRFDEFDHKLICSEIKRRVKLGYDHSDAIDQVVQEHYPIHDFLK